MVYRKINYRKLTGIFLSVLVLFACKKEAKDPIGAKIYAILAHDGTPISGIKWNITETKNKGSNSEITDWELQGATDNAGIDLIEFYPKKNTDYSYDIFFDYSSMNVPLGDYEIVQGPTPYDQLTRQYMTLENTYNIRVLPWMEVTIHYKNVNCYDGEDTFKYKKINIDEYPNVTLEQLNSYPMTQSVNFNACADYTGGGGVLAGHYVYKWEATRNGITETGLDTFYVAPGVNDVIEMFW